MFFKKKKSEREGGTGLLSVSVHGAQPLSAAANPLLLLNTLSPSVKGAFHHSSSAEPRPLKATFVSFLFFFYICLQKYI